jgi:dTDP-glucose 4,6-dehydratase
LAGVRSSSINGTQTILNAIRDSKERARVLNLSSGAVYGMQRTSEGKVPEIAEFGEAENSYAEVKIEIEQDLNKLELEYATQVTHARLFAFAGPFISLTDHFAIGNFLNHILSKSPIVVSGNPETSRSYMYPTDLVASLVRVLGKPEIPYLNVGSAEGYNMRVIAELCSKVGGNLPIEYKGKAAISSHYVPVVDRQTKILQLSPSYDLKSSITQWMRWIKESDVH